MRRKLRKTRYFAFLLGWLIALPAPFASADMGRLAQYLDLGFSDGWTGKNESNAYWLENQQMQGAIRYYFAPYSQGDGGNRRISIDVRLDTQDPQARVGLLYGYDSSTGHYYLIVLGPRGEFEIVRRDASGFNLQMSSTTGAKPGAFNRISIQENGNEVSYSVNGRDLGAIGNNSTGRGAVGIVAVGVGRFGFSNFKESGKSAQLEDAYNPASGNYSGFAAPNQSRGRSPNAMPTAAISSPVSGSRTHIIRDEFGFEQPVTAMTVTLPEGWVVDGNVQWYGRPTCVLDYSKIHLMATAPDGKQWVEHIPGGTWGWSSWSESMPQSAANGIGGCDARRITDIRTFVDQYIPKIRPGAKIQQSRMRPDIVQKLTQTLARDIAASLDPSQRMRIEAMEIRLTYESNGHRVNELLIPTLLFVDQSGLPDAFGGRSSWNVIGKVLATMTTATVEGPAEERLIDMVGEGMKHEESYLRRLQVTMQQKAQLQNQAAARKRAAWSAYRAASSSTSANWQVDKTGSEILDIGMDTYKNTSSMNNAGHARAVDGIHERKPWLNNAGQTIYMPQQYQRAYQLPNNTYVGTNDAFFNPVQTFGEFADPMQPAGY